MRFAKSLTEGELQYILEARLEGEGTSKSENRQAAAAFLFKTVSDENGEKPTWPGVRAPRINGFRLTPTARSRRHVAALNNSERWQLGRSDLK
jgi:hypothetical protein